MKREGSVAKAVIYAKKIGMRVEPDGTVIGARGKPLSPCANKLGYKRVSVCHEEAGRITFGVHSLMAFQKYGDRVFDENVQIRHLNGDSGDNSWDNIALGTPSENQMDKSPEDRVRIARGAAKKKRRYSNSEIKAMRLGKKKGESLRVLAARYGTSKGHMSDIVNLKIYKDT